MSMRDYQPSGHPGTLDGLPGTAGGGRPRPPGPPGPPAGPVAPPVLVALGAVRVELARVGDDRFWSLTDAEVDAALGSVVAARAQLDELGLRLLTAAGQRGMGGAAGSASMASWWAARCGRTRGAAGAEVRLADSLDRRPDNNGCRAGLAAGVVSAEQVAVIERAVDDLPVEVSEQLRAEAESFLVEQAAGLQGAARLAAHHADPVSAASAPVEPHPLGLGPKELTRLGRRLFGVIDPDRADEHEGRLLEAEEARARALTWLRMRPVGDGTTRGSFRLPDAQADMLRTVLEGYASPRRHHRPDTSTSGTGGRTDGTTDGVLDGATAGTRSAPSTEPAEPTEATEPTEPTESTGSAEPSGLAGLSYAERLGLALCELCEHVPLDKLPQAGGVAATISLTMQLKHLLDRLGAATLSTGTVISAGQARRLACGAALLPIVFDGESLVLDAGRDKRLYDRRDRIVMAARDGGCIFPGCDRPPGWCEAHHLTCWAKGGRTDVADGCLVCPYHHHLLHAGQWTAQMGPDGVPEVIPPARMDPTRIPRRHERFTHRPAPRRTSRT